MNLPEKVAEGIQHCVNIGEDGSPVCSSCPYDNDDPFRDCVRELLIDIQNYINACDQYSQDMIEHEVSRL